MTMTNEPSLFDNRAHARRSDPLSSDITVKSIARDGGLRALILRAGRDLEASGHQCWNDTELTERIEEITNVRQQRNVVARARGLMEKEDLILRLGAYLFRGRPGVVHFVVNPHPNSF